MFRQSVSHKIIFRIHVSKMKKVNLLNPKCSHSAKFKKITDIYISIARAFAVNRGIAQSVRGDFRPSRVRLRNDVIWPYADFK